MTYDELKDARAEWPTNPFRNDEETPEEKTLRAQVEMDRGGILRLRDRT